MVQLGTAVSVTGLDTTEPERRVERHQREERGLQAASTGVLQELFSPTFAPRPEAA
jgi:hypothetical protein